MLQLSQCALHYTEDTYTRLHKKVAAILGISTDDIQHMKVVRRSIDARKKPNVLICYTVTFHCKHEERVYKRNRHNKNLSTIHKKPSLSDEIPKLEPKEKIIVVGMGPAGLFCAYYLALCGLRPILIERGAPVEQRTKDVAKFWDGGKLDPESNVSFGEGGAGTFSDGKLNTGVKDRSGRKAFVLESFVQFGASEDILYEAKPHVGTDVLCNVLINMRKRLQDLGCEIYFHTRLTDIYSDGVSVTGVGVHADGKMRDIPCDRLVLAIGHSARDTFYMLRDAGVKMCRKPFAMGVRVQHLQSDIDLAQYGVIDDRLGVSPYKCTGKTQDGRGVYSFCMCPGGYVVDASTESGGLAVNGMSNKDRDSGYANSAIVVAVNPEDYEGEDSLAGIEYQRRYERLAYALCDGHIPVQRFGDFCRDKETVECGKVIPCVKGSFEYANLRQALPNYVANGIMDGMSLFQKKIKGFADEDTLLLGLESRTSSPVRIERGDDLESLSLQGMYPCGEGAGYAGGIMSAAMDGLKVAMKIKDSIQQQEETHELQDCR